jgi:hypothetical protein
MQPDGSKERELAHSDVAQMVGQAWFQRYRLLVYAATVIVDG